MFSRTCAPVVAPALQLLSSSADGLLKLWSVKSTECLNTFDEHEDKVRTMMVVHAAHARSERPQSAIWYLLVLLYGFCFMSCCGSSAVGTCGC